MKLDAIRAVIARKAVEHPELNRPLRWIGLYRIVRREGIALYVTALPRPAMLASYLGGWGIFLSSSEPARRHTYYAVHELGHLWLHHDQACDRWETCFNMDTDWPDDPREDDAECFATLVLNGPDFGISQEDRYAALKARLVDLRSRPRPMAVTPKAPSPGEGPPPGRMPDPGKIPDPGRLPDPGKVPNPGRMPQPGTMPPPGKMPNPGELPRRSLIPGPPFAPRAAPPTASEGVGTITAEWYGGYRLCEPCALDDGRVVSVQQARAMLPTRGCYCKRGCRCRWVALEEVLR